MSPPKPGAGALPVPGQFAAEALGDLQRLLRMAIARRSGKAAENALQLMAEMFGEALLGECVMALRQSVKFVLPEDGHLWMDQVEPTDVPLNQFAAHDSLTLIEFNSSEQAFDGTRGLIAAPRRMALILDLTDATVWKRWSRFLSSLKDPTRPSPLLPGCLVWPIEETREFDDLGVRWAPSWIAAYVPFTQSRAPIPGSSVSEQVRAERQRLGLETKDHHVFASLSFEPCLMGAPGTRSVSLLLLKEKTAEYLSAELGRKPTELEVDDGVADAIWADVRMEIRATLELSLALSCSNVMRRPATDHKSRRRKAGAPQFEYQHLVLSDGDAGVAAQRLGSGIHPGRVEYGADGIRWVRASLRVR